MRHLALPTAFICAVTACSDHRTPAEPTGTSDPLPIAAAQARPTEVDETPFVVPFCGFPVRVVLSGKGKTIELGGGRTILTAPGLTATLTNVDNGNQETLGITGAFHQKVLENGDAVVVFTGRNALFEPTVPGFGSRSGGSAWCSTPAETSFSHCRFRTTGRCLRATRLMRRSRERLPPAPWGST